MDADKKRISLEDLTEAERALLAREALQNNSSAEQAPYIKEFRPSVPSGSEGGSEPHEINLKTAEAIQTISEDAIESSSLTQIEPKSVDSKATQALQHLQEGEPFVDGKGGDYGYELTEFLRELQDGQEKKE